MDQEYQKLLDEAKEYASLRIKMFKLELLEKLSLILTLFVVVMVVVVLLLTALTYFSLASVYALKDVLGGMAIGLSIVGGLFVLITVLILIFRKQWILNPLIKSLSNILFKEDEKNQ